MLIGLAGCGRWGRNILRDLLSLGVTVIVADVDEAARDFGHRAGVSTVSTVQQLPACDGFIVATTTSTHNDVLRTLLPRAVPIFVEKPMVIDPVQASELESMAPNRLFVMDKWRYHPGIQELRRIAESGELGRPLGIRARHVGWGLPHRDVDVAWILVPHCFSIALEVLGKIPAPTAAIGEWLHGTLVSLSGLAGSDPWLHLDASARSPRKTRQFELHCEGGVAWLDDGWAGHIQVARGKDGYGGDAGAVEVRSISNELPLLRELTAFVEHLSGGPPPRSSAAEGAAVVRAIYDLRALAGEAR